MCKGGGVSGPHDILLILNSNSEPLRFSTRYKKLTTTHFFDKVAVTVDHLLILTEFFKIL